MITRSVNYCVAMSLLWASMLLFHTICTSASIARVYPAVLGSSVTLECSIRQEDKLVWDRGDGSTALAVNGAFFPGVNTSSYLLQNTSIGQSLIIHSLSLVDDGTYRCYDLKNASNKQLMNVTILVEPAYVWSTGPSGVIEEGTKQVFTCTADGGKPPPYIQWVLIDRKAVQKTFSGINNDRRYINGTYRRTNRLELTTSRDMYMASMICKVSISYFYNVQQTMVLDVNLYPLAPKFTDFTGLFDDGRVHNIECYSTGSRPAGSIYWEIDGRKVSSTADSKTKGADGLFYQSSTLSMRLTKNIQGQMLKCLVTNQVLQNQRKPDLFVQVMLLANFAPSITADNGSRTVAEDKEIIMTCIVDARPLPVSAQFIWVHNGKPITSNDVHNITNNVLSISKMTSTLHISPVSRDSYGQYYCQATNHLGIEKSKVLTLDVQYRPVCAFQIKERHAGVLGKRLTLNCPVTSNPQNVTMTWRYVTRSSPPIRENLVGLRMVNGVRYTTIDIDIRSDNQFTDIECVATNSLGSSKAPCLYRIVKPGPPEIPHDCQSKANGDTELVISCTPGFDGGYHQYFILQHLDDGQFHPADNNSDPIFTVRGLSPAINATYRVCSTTDAFPQVTSCSNPITITTDESSPAGQKRDDSVESATSLPYIIGGVCGFLALVVIIIAVIYCVRRKRQVCKRLPQKKTLSGKHSTPCMPTITDYFTHAQFQSVVAFPKNNLQESLHRHSDRSTHSLIKSGSIDTDREHFYRQEQISNDVPVSDANKNDYSANSVIDGESEGRNWTLKTRRSSRQRWNSSERLRAIDASTRLEAIRVSSDKASAHDKVSCTKKTDTPKLTNKEAEKMRSRSNSRTKDVDDSTALNGFIQHKETVKDNKDYSLELSEYGKKEKDGGIFLNLAFAHDEITDLDEFSHPRSPHINLLAGGPRHEFCYSETDISAAITSDDKIPGADMKLRKSRSHESLSDLKTMDALQLEKKHNYINLAYDRGDQERHDDVDRHSNIDKNLLREDTDPFYPQHSLYIDDSLKRSFVSQYSIQSSRSFDWNSDNPVNDTESFDVSSDEMNTIPRRKSYNIAIGTTNKDADTNPYRKEKIYDVPRISMIEGENLARIYREQIELTNVDQEQMDSLIDEKKRPNIQEHVNLPAGDTENVESFGINVENLNVKVQYDLDKNTESTCIAKDYDESADVLQNHNDSRDLDQHVMTDDDPNSEYIKQSIENGKSEFAYQNQHQVIENIDDDARGFDNKDSVEISVAVSGEKTNIGIFGSLEATTGNLESSDTVETNVTEEDGVGIDIIVGSETFTKPCSASEKDNVTNTETSSAVFVPDGEKDSNHHIVAYF